MFHSFTKLFRRAIFATFAMLLIVVENVTYRYLAFTCLAITVETAESAVPIPSSWVTLRSRDNTTCSRRIVEMIRPLLAGLQNLYHPTKRSLLMSSCGLVRDDFLLAPMLCIAGKKRASWLRKGLLQPIFTRISASLIPRITLYPGPTLVWCCCLGNVCKVTASVTIYKIFKSFIQKV